MLLIVRRAIFLTAGEVPEVVCFSGVCTDGFAFSSDLSSASCWPEKIGSRISAKSDGSTIFFLRLVVLSGSVKVQSTGVCSCSVCTACRIRCLFEVPQAENRFR